MYLLSCHHTVDANKHLQLPARIWQPLIKWLKFHNQGVWRAVFWQYLLRKTVSNRAGKASNGRGSPSWQGPPPKNGWWQQLTAMPILSTTPCLEPLTRPPSHRLSAQSFAHLETGLKTKMSKLGVGGGGLNFNFTSNFLCVCTICTLFRILNHLQIEMM